MRKEYGRGSNHVNEKVHAGIHDDYLRNKIMLLGP